MPMYRYRCGCGAQRDVFKSLRDIDSPEQCYTCAEVGMERLICAPAVVADYAGYECPVSGRWVEGRKAHAENLARTGCRLREPGEAEVNARIRRERAEAEIEAIGETVQREVAALPPRKLERLAAELDGGMGLGVTRPEPSAIL